MYYHGHGVDVNYKKAREWYEKAAEQGRAEAQYNLGVMYYHGKGVDQSDSMAMRWYAKADAQGFEGAQVAIRELVSKRRGSSTSIHL
jgi:TPR repeat protein